MAHYSDTESEPGSSVSGWDPGDSLQMANELGHIGDGAAGMLTVPDALERLAGLDICAVKQDERLHEEVQQVSSALLSFLDGAITAGQVNGQNPEKLQAALCMMLHATSMTLLLDYRFLFRDLAARSLDGSTSAIAVCWVDVVLAKLGRAIVAVAGLPYSACPSDHSQPDAVRAQKEDDLLRAAVQLPDSWPNIVRVLSSEFASPAAVRLATTLVWGRTVMANELAEDRSSSISGRISDDLLKALQSRIKRLGKRSHSGLAMQLADLDEYERVAYAMLISLYAMATSTASTGHADSPYRPQSHAVLLELVEAILRADTSAPLSSSSPVVTIDLPRMILLKWGRTIPWSWQVWSDARLHQSEVAECLTATWLQHLNAPISDIRVGHSVEWWDAALVETLQCAPTAALSMLSRLLSSAMPQVKRSQPTTLDGPALDMILKVCWSIKHVLQLVHVDVTTFSTLYGLMYTIFMALEDEETELAIKDLLIEGLSFSANGLQQALDDVGDPQSDCARTLERRLGRMIKLVNATLSSGEVVRMLDMRSIRQTLQILTLAWTAGRRPCALRGLVQQFLTIVVDWVDFEWLESEAWMVVGDAMIVALAAWKRYTNAIASPVPAGKAGEKLVGELIEDADPLELPLAAALAQYFCEIMKHPPYNALALSEAFNHFRDVALLILDHEYGGTDEPLSLLVAPAIFRALIALVQYAPPATRNYITSSPWTLCLVMHMKRLEDEGQSEEYYQILREQVYSLIKILCHNLQLSQTASPSEIENVSLDLAGLTYGWTYSGPCLIQG